MDKTDNKIGRYLITAALPYANGLKHIGHLAGAYLPADIYVRYLKAQKRDVVFVCGSDEHGTAIPIQAMKEGTTAQAIIDKYHPIIEQNFKDLGIAFDIYHRTSAPLHHETAQEFFTVLNNNGDLEVKESEQYYDEATSTFLADRYIKGTCPVCGNDNAYGDQCEKCGSTLSPDMLINPVSTLSGNAPIKKSTKHWYLPLDRHEEFLRNWILTEHKDDWRTSVLGQCKSWIDGGLQARAVTRDLDWGIKVPDSPPAPQEGVLGVDNLGSDYKSSEVFLNPPLEGREAGYKTADPMMYGVLKKFVNEQRSNPTQAEIVLWELLRGKQLDGYKFRRQHIIGSFIADFVCLSANLIVEVDGLIHQTPENLISDLERTKLLNEMGFEVIRFTNDEVLYHSNVVLEKILKKINSLLSPPDPQERVLGADNLGSDYKSSEAFLNPPLEGREAAGKVLYVWFDAPIGYISATKQWAINNEKDWKPYWYAPDTKLVHFVGKDNIVFHCIIFPVMLKLHGNILPTNVPANEFMNLEGDKMSTSRGWSIEMDDYIKEWIKKDNGGEGMADVLRYYLTQIAPETKDSEFTWKGFQDANNSELVNIFGNFVNRTFVLMHKLCGGKVPVFHNDIIDDADKQLILDIKASAKKVEGLLEGYKFRDALFDVIDLARKGNKYMQDKEPWMVAKRETVDGILSEEGKKSIDNCLHLCLQLTANLTILINPFLPFTAGKLCKMMKVVVRMLEWENAGRIDLLKVGYSLREPQLLFRKIENEEIEAQLIKLKASVENRLIENNNKVEEVVVKKELEPVGTEIVFDDFAKIDLRVGTIVAAEKVPKADKLLQLSVDLGFETRTIVSGIALHFTPEEIVGKQVTVVVNLAPRKMRGIESNGMILMAEDGEGKLHFVKPESIINNGASVK